MYYTCFLRGEPHQSYAQPLFSKNHSHACFNTMLGTSSPLASGPRVTGSMALLLMAACIDARSYDRPVCV